MLLRKPATEQLDDNQVASTKNGELSHVYLVPSHLP